MSRYRRLREDDEDRVILPTFGEKESDLNLLQMARDVEKRKQTKEEERRRAKRKELYSKKYARLFNELQDVDSIEDKMEFLFKELVPSAGKADTKAGELVRAMMRVLYRDYNDGDIFYAGYGKETAGPAAEFLYQNADETMRSIIDDIVASDCVDDEYSAKLVEMSACLIDFLTDNPELLSEPNEEDMFDYEPRDILDNVNYYEFECDFGEYAYNVINEYVKNEDILDDARGDIEGWLEDFVSRYTEDGEVEQPWKDGYVLTNLTIEDLHNVEENWDVYARELDDYLEGEYDFDASPEDEEEDW